MTRHSSTQEELGAPQAAAVQRMVEKLGLEAHPKEVVDALAHEGVRVTPAEVQQVQANYAAGAAAQDTSRPADTHWAEHEQHADEVVRTADRLVEASGTEERAVDAVRRAAQRQASVQQSRQQSAAPVQESPSDRLADELGFASYLELFEASTPVGSIAGRAWCLTHLAGGQWVLWNDRELRVEGRYSTQEEALAGFSQRHSASETANREGGTAS